MGFIMGISRGIECEYNGTMMGLYTLRVLQTWQAGNLPYWTFIAGKIMERNGGFSIAIVYF